MDEPVGSHLPEVAAFVGGDEELVITQLSCKRWVDPIAGTQVTHRHRLVLQHDHRVVADDEQGALIGHLMHARRPGEDHECATEERKALETRAQLLENRIFRSRTPGQRAYELDEPFAQAETNRQAFQQLMVKNAVAAASEMGMNFVAFPGAESAQAQLYKNLPNNLKQVVKDLGPGFEYRSITLSGPKGEMMHPAIVWNPDGAPADRIRNQGIPFRDGGEVRRSTARQMLAELA